MQREVTKKKKRIDVQMVIHICTREQRNGVQKLQKNVQMVATTYIS